MKNKYIKKEIKMIIFTFLLSGIFYFIASIFYDARVNKNYLNVSIWIGTILFAYTIIYLCTKRKHNYKYFDPIVFLWTIILFQIIFYLRLGPGDKSSYVNTFSGVGISIILGIDIFIKLTKKEEIKNKKLGEVLITYDSKTINIIDYLLEGISKDRTIDIEFAQKRLQVNKCKAKYYLKVCKIEKLLIYDETRKVYVK